MQRATRTKRGPRHTGAALAAATLLFIQGVVHNAVDAGPQSAMHYALQGNFDPVGNYLPGSIGFNLADVNNVAQLDSLPDGVNGLVRFGRRNGIDTTFLHTVRQ